MKLIKEEVEIKKINKPVFNPAQDIVSKKTEKESKEFKDKKNEKD